MVCYRDLPLASDVLLLRTIIPPWNPITDTKGGLRYINAIRRRSTSRMALIVSNSNQLDLIYEPFYYLYNREDRAFLTFQ